MSSSAGGQPPHTRSRARRPVRAAAVVLTALVMVVILMWSLQRSLIYFPDTSEVPPAPDVLSGGQDLTLRTSDGLELGAWFAPAAAGAEDRELAVLIAPGNGGNRLARAGLAESLQQQGFAVLVMDYRGYGGNPGRPSEDGLIQDGLAAVEALEAEGYPPERTIYFGESLGGGVVAALLVQRPPAAVVLRSPFTELAEVGRHHYPWLPVRTILRDEFPVTPHVAQSQVPISVIRAEEDSVVPAELSAEVAAAAPNLVQEQVIDDADHNDPVMFGSEIAEAVARLAAVIDS
ncbi:alpha/beta hydrolase [Nesterenkonia muleiensis]|uniref:alpha/beta hydrolase n=1 Tax=Nesterenkonia muleiensis TaxID=2282648 RepID=UPI000E74AD43|nr:alpha/beta fold hydrolase [Nesterenkonia muleiensis]